MDTPTVTLDYRALCEIDLVGLTPDDVFRDFKHRDRLEIVIITGWPDWSN